MVEFLGSYGTGKVRVGLWFDRREAVLVSVLSDGNSSVLQAFKRLILREGRLQKPDLLQVQGVLSSHNASLEVLTSKPSSGQAERALPARSDALAWLADSLADVEAELSKLKEEREHWRGVQDLTLAHARLDGLSREIEYLGDKLVDETQHVKLTYRSDFGPSPQQALDRARLREYRSSAKREEADIRQRMEFTYRTRIAELEGKRRELLDRMDRERERQSERRGAVAAVLDESSAMLVSVTVRSRPVFASDKLLGYAKGAVREACAETATLRAKLSDRLGLRFEPVDELALLGPLFLASPVFLKRLSARGSVELAEAVEDAFALVPKDASEKEFARSVAGLLAEMPTLAVSPDMSRFPRVQGGKRLAFLGRAIDSTGEAVDLPVLFDLDEQAPRHVSVTGGSGSGKSVAARVLVEGALVHGVPVLVFDPTRAWAGFTAPCTDERVLARYRWFQMQPGWAKGFSVRTVRAAGDDAQSLWVRPGLTLLAAWDIRPEDERSAVRGLLERIREAVAAWPESRTLKALLVLEEAHRYLQDKELEPLLEGLARTARARGLGLLFVSQNCVDLPPGVRNNTATKIQMQTGYGPDLTRAGQIFGTDAAKRIPSLKQGEGVLNYPEYGTVFLAFRPPLHSPHAAGQDMLPGPQLVQEASTLVAPPKPKQNEGSSVRPSVPDKDWRLAARAVVGQGTTSRLLAEALQKQGIPPPSERTLRRFLHELRTKVESSSQA